jgi:8-oxo-dGTP diphosphatase
MDDLRRMIFEAKRDNRAHELFGEQPEVERDASPLFPPPGRGVSYGCVVVDASRQRVLLRRPANGHNGFAWTFAKGMPDSGETPEETAVREAGEEYGRQVCLLAPIRQWFCGPKWANWFWLAEDCGERPGGFHWETEAVRWFTWSDAGNAIKETSVPHRRDRDLDILAAARALAGTGICPVSPAGAGMI